MHSPREASARCFEEKSKLFYSFKSGVQTCGVNVGSESDADVAVPLVCYVLVGGIILYLAYAVFVGDPPWPPIIREDVC